MSGLFTSTARTPRALTLVLLAAFLLRALVPSGWMPHASSATGVIFIICTVAGIERVSLSPDGKLVPLEDSGQTESNHDPCPFASTAKFSPPILRVALAPLAAAPDFVAVTEKVVAPAATHLRLAESRAPPVSSL